MRRRSSPNCSISMLRRFAIGAYILLCLAVLWGITRLHSGPTPPVVIGHALYLGG